MDDDRKKSLTTRMSMRRETIATTDEVPFATDCGSGIPEPAPKAKSPVPRVTQGRERRNKATRLALDLDLLQIAGRARRDYGYDEEALIAKAGCACLKC